ncbi:MAG: DNA-methyltransferase [Candidatus Hodarchaeales archaeon]|jgi:adenine-specific DNA-methyltransferase
MEEQFYNHKLFLGDAEKILDEKEKISNKSIQTIVTSPPYGLSKEYGKNYDDKFNLDTWKKMMMSIARSGQRILKDNGSFFINVSPVPKPDKTKEIIPLDSIIYFIFKEEGYFLRNKIIWHFNNMQNCTKRLSGRWEAILWFVKDLKDYVFNLDDVRLPYITKGDKRIERRGGTGRNPTDVWYIDRVNNMTKKKLGIDHPTVYPEKMIERVLLMSSNVGDVILDPFVGSGTTMVVARKLKRNSIGIEINAKYLSTIEKRVLPEQVPLFENHFLEVIKDGDK